MSRAERRHQEERRKKQVQRLFKHAYLSDLSNDVKFVGKHASTRKRCSCWMCGNQRKNTGEGPIQERRQNA